jgi:peptidyl-prolyl cis-trans isomerase D
MDYDVTGVDDGREVVRWAFNADDNALSQPFESGNQYVVAKLIQARKEGYAPLALVKSEVEVLARQAKKAELLTARMEKAKSNSIDEVSSALGVSVLPIEDVVFARASVTGYGFEPALVGAMYGIAEQKVSQPIVGNNGVYAFIVTGKSTPNTITDPSALRTTLEKQQKQNVFSTVMDALESKEKVVDHRYKFY